MSKILCILGMHRSGTSLVANWLHNCGLNIGDEMLRADFSNKRGHFEDLQFLELHKELLSSSNLDPTGLDLESVPELDENSLSRLRDLWDQKTNKSQWGFKEPRTTLFIRYYLQLEPDLKFLVVLRDYHKIVRSLMSRDLERVKLQEYNGLLGGIRWKRAEKKVMEKIEKEEQSRYLLATTVYFRQILWVLENHDPSCFEIMDIENKNKFDEVLSRKIIGDWNFDLETVPFESVFEERLKDKKGLEFQVRDHEELDKLQARIQEKIAS